MPYLMSKAENNRILKRKRGRVSLIALMAIIIRILYINILEHETKKC